MGSEAPKAQATSSSLGRLNKYCISLVAYRYVITICNRLFAIDKPIGRMAELAYAIALGAIGVTLGGSNPLPPTRYYFSIQYAGVAQLVERNLAKVNVAGSNPVSRFKN